jgi:hypothetical protein
MAAFFGSRTKWDSTMESVLKGKAPSAASRQKPLGKNSIGTSVGVIFCRAACLQAAVAVLEHGQ